MSGPSPARRSPKITRRRFLVASGLTLVGVTGVGHLESKNIEVTRNTLYLPNWDADGFKIAQITDTHIDNLAALDRAAKAVHLAIAEKPDVIFFTGDFATGGDSITHERIVSAFEPLFDVGCPSFAIFGNHDWSGGRPWVLDPLIRKQTAMTLLRNEMAECQGVTLAGMDDALYGQHRPDVITRDQSSRSLLVLLHEPDYVTDMPSFASLTLCGHSHGGEICLPGGVPIHTPRGANELKVGFYPKAQVPTYVCRGIGHLGPGRVFCAPELAVFTVRKTDGAPAIQSIA